MSKVLPYKTNRKITNIKQYLFALLVTFETFPVMCFSLLIPSTSFPHLWHDMWHIWVYTASVTVEWQSSWSHTVQLEDSISHVSLHGFFQNECAFHVYSWPFSQSGLSVLPLLLKHSSPSTQEDIMFHLVAMDTTGCKEHSMGESPFENAFFFITHNYIIINII